MLETSWLGVYRHGTHEDDGGVRTIELSRDGELVGFRYAYRCYTNHGFDREHEVGTVIAVDDHAIRIEVVKAAASSWEDLFKEFRDTKSTERYETEFRIVRLEGGRPVFLVRGDLLTYVEPDEV